MSKTETYHCDIKKCERNAVHLAESFQVIFTTEQTEGRSTKPYFSMEKIDICADCKQMMLNSRTYILAHGAQGSNVYELA